MQSLCHYYPGGNTPEGFFSYYHEILDKASTGKLAVIKGGPGTGKSTFLKRLGKLMEEEGEPVTYLHCSSDPASLDGIYLPRRNSAVIDGTAPHLTDPRYPGASDMVLNFCDLIGPVADGETVANESKLAKESFLEGYCYLNGAKSLLNLMQTRSKSTLLSDEIRAFSSDIVRRISSFSATGFCKTAFLSAITADGFCHYLQENLRNYYVISVEAEEGDDTASILETVATACTLRNADMIVCPCPMNPKKAEHLLFPSANLAVVTSNAYHTYPKADEIVSFSDFVSCRRGDYELAALYDTLLHRGVDCFTHARNHHNCMEAIYQTVTDYSAIEPFYQKTHHFLLS